MAEAQEYAMKQGIDLLSLVQGTAAETGVKEENEDETDGKSK